MSGWWIRHRRTVALVVAPLVPPALSMIRPGYLSMGGHLEKYWTMGFVFTVVACIGSAMAAAPVLIGFRLAKYRPGALAIVPAFMLSCVLIGLAVGPMMLGPEDRYGLAEIGLIGALIVGPIYCLIAGTPWRLRLGTAEAG